MKTYLQQEWALIKAQRNNPLLYLLWGGTCVWGSLVLGWPALTLILFTGICTLLALIDAKTTILPDLLTLPGIAFGLILSPIPLDLKLWGAGIGTALFLLLTGGYYVIKKKHGMGYGDVKLLALLGAWLGVSALLPLLLIASLTALIAMLLRQKLADIPTSKPIPFGPFLILGGWLSLLYGHHFWALIL